jgi:hypothetical protein
MRAWQRAAVVIALSGCGHAAIDAQSDRRVEAARAETNELYRAPACDDGAVLGPSCGFVVARARTPEFRANFKAQKCATVQEAECDALLDGAVEEWVTRRYNLAVASDVDKTCEASAGTCDDALEWEKLMLASHNDVLRGVGQRREASINERRSTLHAEETARQRQAAIANAIVQANLAAQQEAANEQAARSARANQMFQNPYRHHVTHPSTYTPPPVHARPH